MKYRIKALLARLFPRWFSPSLTDEQIRAIWNRARNEAFIRQFTAPQEQKP